MYPEFVAIYIGLGILAIMLAVVIILQVIIIKKSASRGVSKTYTPVSSFSKPAPGGVIFCTRCAKQYDSMHNVCPHCGAPRM